MNNTNELQRYNGWLKVKNTVLLARVAELEAENSFLFDAALGCCNQEWLREELSELKKMAEKT